MLRLVSLFALAMTAAPLAAQLAMRVDTARSTVGFRVPHMVIHHVSGEFHSFEGTIEAASSDLDGARVTAVVDVGSIDTQRPERDENLRSDDFFAAATYPTMRFESAPIRRVGVDRYLVDGTLTLRGVSRPIRLEARRTASADPRELRIAATGKINRFDFGLRYNVNDFFAALSRAVPVVGDTVEIRLDISFLREEAPDPVAAATEFVAGLSPATRTAAIFPFESEERLRWGRSPARRPGLRLGEATAQERAALFDMLRSVLSDRGFGLVRAILAEQDALGPEEGIGADHYWMAVYGEPGVGSWGWRFGGHHVSLHATFDGRRLLALGPLFLGGGEVPGVAAERLAPRQELARALVRSLDGAARQRVAAPALGSLDLDPRREGPLLRDSGVAVAGLNEAQQRLVQGMLAEHLDVVRAEYRSLFTGCDAQRGARRFVWAGSAEPGQAHYYRVDAPGVAIEYVNHGNHVHSLLTSDSDFGASGPPSDAC